MNWLECGRSKQSRGEAMRAETLWWRRTNCTSMSIWYQESSKKATTIWKIGQSVWGTCLTPWRDKIKKTTKSIKVLNGTLEHYSRDLNWRIYQQFYNLVDVLHRRFPGWGVFDKVCGHLHRCIRVHNGRQASSFRMGQMPFWRLSM